MQRFKTGSTVNFRIAGEDGQGVIIEFEETKEGGEVFRSYHIDTEGFDRHRESNTGDLWVLESEIVGPASSR